MPKIKAPTVHAHREAQRRAILTAARGIVLDEGLHRLKFGRVAERTGLARSSIYAYYRTKADLLDALLASEVPRWKADLQAVLARAVEPRRAIGFFVEGQLTMIAEGRHELAFAVMGAQPSALPMARIDEIHAQIFGLLTPALTALGVRDQQACLRLVQGAIHAMAPALRHEAERRRWIVASTVTFVVGGIVAMAQTQRVADPATKAGRID